MNLLRFLKSTKGAIKPLNALLLSGAAGVGFFFVANTAANKQISAERQVRTLSGITQSSQQESMRRQGGMLTSINVRDGRNQLATAEERAAMSGNSALDRYNANQRALDKMGSSLGKAAQFSDSDSGLNTGNRETENASTRFSVGNPHAHAVGAAAGAYVEGQADGATGSASGTNHQLASASMARASGNSFSGSYGPVSGANAGGAPSARTGAGGEGTRLSGAMPGGSNIVSQLGREGAGAGTRTGSSSFGQNRNGRAGRSQNVGNNRDELRDILKKSAAADANVNASANEGGRAFLASAISSGGITVDGQTDTGSATSSDFTGDTDRTLKAVGNRLKQEEQEQDDRQKKNEDLLFQLITTALGSIGVIVAGAKILSKLDASITALEAELKTQEMLLATMSASPLPGMQAAAAAMQAKVNATRALLSGAKLKRKIAAIAMVTLVTGANGFLFVMAKKFAHEYGGSGGINIATVAQTVAPILVAASVQTAITPTWSGFFKAAWGRVKGSLSQIAMSVVGPKI